MRQKAGSAGRSFWADKTPCWVMRGCIPAARTRCAAYINRGRPCWEQDILCKQLFDIDTCFNCEVRERYGNGSEPVADCGAYRNSDD
ncbi:MAG: MerR family transcriptional regulator [Planctomycetota bacterium]|jgi:hypothetical protein